MQIAVALERRGSSAIATADSEPGLRAALKKGGNKDVTIKVFERAGHPLLECETGLRAELPGLKRFVPGYHDLLGDWLERRR